MIARDERRRRGGSYLTWTSRITGCACASLASGRKAGQAHCHARRHARPRNMKTKSYSLSTSHRSVPFYLLHLTRPIVRHESTARNYDFRLLTVCFCYSRACETEHKVSPTGRAMRFGRSKRNRLATQGGTYGGLLEHELCIVQSRHSRLQICIELTNHISSRLACHDTTQNAFYEILVFILRTIEILKCISKRPDESRVSSRGANKM